MGCLAMNDFDYADVQGLVRFGYKKMTKASYALLHIRNAVAALHWLLSASIANSIDCDS
jgi:hypothetical protein